MNSMMVLYKAEHFDVDLSSRTLHDIDFRVIFNDLMPLTKKTNGTIKLKSF